MQKQKWIAGIASIIMATTLLAACGPKTAGPDKGGNVVTKEPGQAGKGIAINGAGATFPQPIYEKWFRSYGAKNAAAKINYQGVGSGGGIKQITEKTVDFGASDAPLKPEQVQAAPGLLQIPTVLGAIVTAYNLPDYKGELKLTGETLSGIYLGEIKKWNDPKLVADNPDLKNVNADIAVAYRSDGSGTTNGFTDYLSKVSSAWKDKVGKGTSVKWPVGVGGKGNDGVAGIIKQTPGAIGYVELAYAENNQMPVATLKNQAGNWVKPTLQAVSEAANDIKEDFTVSITNASGANAWPISSLTYILLYQDPADKAKSAAFVEFMRWALKEGDNEATALKYAPLPPAVEEKAIKVLDSIKTQ